jgi:hypothetical protein
MHNSKYPTHFKNGVTLSMQLNYFQATAVFIAESIKMMACMCVRETEREKRHREKRSNIFYYQYCNC